MNKAHILTVALLLTGLGAGLAWKAGSRTPETTPQAEPQDAIYAMFDAARAGDVKTYLAQFTGTMEASLRQTLSESTQSGFVRYLKDSNASIKGIAVSDPQRITDLEAKVRVEYIYQDRNEAQVMYLAKGATGWKISRADSDERIKTLIPYGTPVRQLGR